MGLDTSYNNILSSSPYNYNINLQDDNSSYKFNTIIITANIGKTTIYTRWKVIYKFWRGTMYIGNTRDECMERVHEVQYSTASTCNSCMYHENTEALECHANEEFCLVRTDLLTCAHELLLKDTRYNYLFCVALQGFRLYMISYESQ